jgi:hypothetical protein
MSRRLLCLALAILGPAAAGAEEISFDERPPANNNAPAPAEEYAQLGVHFQATDDGSVWSGVSGGDPGGWGLEGTNGTAFAGFNGTSYGLRAAFDGPVRELRVDVARSLGSRVGDRFVLRGWRAGEMVEELEVVLGDVNAWATVELASEVDEVSWVGIGTGTRRHPYGVDNLRWTVEPEEIEVAIDVRPGNPRNPLNPFAQGVVPVALLGAADFHVAAVDATTLGFGPERAPAVRSRIEDRNGDGLPDLVTHHRIPETGIALGDAEACLTGEMLDGTKLRGCDALLALPARWRSHHAPGEHPGHGPKQR